MIKFIARDFGEVEITESEVLEFVQPPFGFDTYKKYAVLFDKEVGERIAWLQSIEEASVCFILFDPSGFSDFFKPIVPDDIQDALGEGELVCWVIGVVPEDFTKTTVNLKSPVIINTESKKAAQIILEQDYPVRHPFMKGDE